MSSNFTSGKGIVKTTSSTTSTIKVSGFDPTELSVDSGLVTIDNYEVVTGDLIVPVPCLDGKQVVYSFGKSFGKISLTGTVYPGASSTTKAIQSKMSDAFNAIRVSENKTPVNVSLDEGVKYFAMFTQLTFGKADPKTNAIGYSLAGITVTVTGS